MQHTSLAAWQTYWLNAFKDDNESRGFPIDSVSGKTLGPGGSVYVTKNNFHWWPTLQGGWGKASVGWDKDFTIDTPCGTRSVTKTITHAVALQTEYMRANGQLSSEYSDVDNILEEPISRFAVIQNKLQANPYKYFDGSATVRTAAGRSLVHDNVTIRQIAAHQSRIWPIHNYVHSDGNYRSIMGLVVPRDGMKNLMESIGNIDDLVTQTGAVQAGMDPTEYAKLTNPNAPEFSPLVAHYFDWAAWLTGAVLEEVRGTSLYNLTQEQFGSLGLSNCYASCGGNIVGAGGSTTPVFKGHHSNPIEIPGLAVAYNVFRGADGVTLYHEPGTSTEIGYAIGSAVLSSKNLADWAYKLAYTDAYIPDASLRSKLFTQQTGVPDDDFTKNQQTIDANKSYGIPYTPFADFPRVNWGFGTYKLQSVTGKSGTTIDLWGTIGNGGFGGYSAAVIWVEKGSDKYIFVANSNTGITVNKVYAMARDYIETML